MSIDTGGRRYLAWLGTESGYQPLRADLGTLTGYTEVSRHRRREVVKITLGTGYEARDQFRAALTARGLSYSTVTEIPFDIELVGSGSAWEMFRGCSSLTHVPDLITSQVTNMNSMFRYCSALTDGNVRLIGKHPDVSTSLMIDGSGLTREPFYDTTGNPI